MLTPNRVERRRQQREARKRAPEGLPVETTELHIAAQAALILKHLSNNQNTHRASEAIGLVQEQFAKSVAKIGDLEIQCREGCSYCCHHYVSATVPELFVVARDGAARWGGDFIERVNVANEITLGLDSDARGVTKTACPLLADNRCSIYESRPLVCRSYASFDLAKCQEDFETEGGIDRVPMPMQLHVMRAAYGLALLAALKLSGLSTVVYEMNEAVAKIVETPNAEARWLDGQNIFEGLTPDERANTAEQSANIIRITEHV